METGTTTPNRNLLARIFISPAEPRLRAGWRLLLQTVLMFIFAVLTTLAIGLMSTPAGPNLGLLAGQFVEIIVITGSVFLARWLLDQRSILSLGFQIDSHLLPDLLAGIAISFFMMGFIFIMEYALGWLKFEGFAWENTAPAEVAMQLVTAFITFIFVGWNEELLSRGYHLQTLASGTNLLWGIILSSAVFGALHLGNPNATWVSAAGIFFAGVFLAFGLVRTRQLWLSIGLHIGWNFFEGPFFGFPVSGLDIFPMLRTQINGPVLWTGGAFGPEAGLVVLPSLALGAILIYLYTRERQPLEKVN